MTEQQQVENDEKFEVYEGEVQGDFHLVPTGKTGKKLGWFSFSQVKMHLIKGMINNIAPMLLSCVSHGGEDEDRVDNKTGIPYAKQPVCVLTDKIHKRLISALEKEKGQLIKDNNMAKLINGVRNAVVYISEEDNYYRVWWAYFLTIVWEEMQVYYDSWNPLECEDLGLKAAQFLKDGKKVGLEEAQTNPAFKKQLFYCYLSRHLPYLDKYNVTLKPKNKEKNP